MKPNRRVRLLILCLLLVAMVSHVAIAGWSLAPNSAFAALMLDVPDSDTIPGATEGSYTFTIRHTPLPEPASGVMVAALALLGVRRRPRPRTRR